MDLDLSSRHPSTQHLLELFGTSHLNDELKAISEPFGHLAVTMTLTLDDGPELYAGLRKLVEAKDCFVRQRVMELRENRGGDTGAV